MAQLSICHVVNGLNRGFGGPSVSVSSLASALVAECGIGCDVVASDHPERGPVVPCPGARAVLVPPPRLSLPWGYDPAIDRVLKESIESADIVHIHGLWRYIYWRARRHAESLGKPLIVSPRGMLSPWALAQKPVRKSVALHLFERRTLEACALFHASSPREADDIRALGLSQPIAIVSNGVAAPEMPGDASRFELRHGVSSGKIVLFLSRLHPGKGLEDLLRAWTTLDSAAGATLVVAGDGERAYVDSLRRLAIGASCPVIFTGGVWGEDKEDAFAAADLFVLPSSSESFGMAIAEALARGVPAIATRDTPWELLSDEKAGWWVRRGELAECLKEAISTESRVLHEMGQRGRELVAERMSWTKAARDMSQAYRWLTEGGEAPQFLRVN